jgi:hypothetical protein
MKSGVTGSPRTRRLVAVRIKSFSGGRFAGRCRQFPLMRDRAIYGGNFLCFGGRRGTHRRRTGFPTMSISLSQLLEESFQIAWEYLERTGELGDGATASRFLSDTIEALIRRGQRSRLALSNRAIAAYLRFRISAATVSSRVRTSA